MLSVQMLRVAPVFPRVVNEELHHPADRRIAERQSILDLRLCALFQLTQSSLVQAHVHADLPVHPLDEAHSLEPGETRFTFTDYADTTGSRQGCRRCTLVGERPQCLEELPVKLV